MIIVEEVLPFLIEIQCSDPEIIMSIIGNWFFNFEQFPSDLWRIVQVFCFSFIFSGQLFSLKFVVLNFYSILWLFFIMSIFDSVAGILLFELKCKFAHLFCLNISGIYKHLLSDKQFGLTHNLLATKVMPSLIPHSVDPGLNIDQVWLHSSADRRTQTYSG